MSLAVAHDLVELREAPASCPCCGNVVKKPYDDNVIGFDWENGMLFRGSQRVYMSFMQADLFKVLLEHWPKLAPREKLISSLWGSNKDGMGEENLAVYIAILRGKIKEFDLGVKNFRGRGWLLERLDRETSA